MDGTPASAPTPGDGSARAARAGRKRLPELSDLYRIVNVATPDHHPATGRLAYVLERAEPGRFLREVWVREGGEARRVTAGGDSERNPRFSPDGRKLAFLSNATGTEQLWVADLATGQVRQLTRMRHGVARPAWSPDGLHIAFESPVFPDEAEDAVVLGEGERRRDRRDEPIVVEELGFKSDDVGGYREAVPTPAVWVVASEGGRPRRLTPGPARHVLPVWSPDGRSLLVLSNRERRPTDYIGMDLFLFPFPPEEGAAAPRQLTSGLYVAYYPKRIVPRFTPDGREVVFGALDPDRGGVPVALLYRVPVEGGEPVRLFGNEAPCDGATRFLYNATWHSEAYETMQVSEDGRDVYFIAGWQGTGNIYRVPLAGGPVEAVTTGRQNFAQLSPPYAGRAIATRTDALHPYEIVEVDLQTGEVRELTDLNPWLREVALADMQELWVETLDGTARVQGWVLLPPGCEAEPPAAASLPAVLYVHGGPATFYGYALDWEHQSLAAAGLAVLIANPRGSAGYGAQFSSMEYIHDAAFYDLLQFVDAALRAFPAIDPERVGVCGGSYGGYATVWLASHTRRFRAAAAHRAPVNELIGYASSDMGANGRSKVYATYRDFLVAALERSPIVRADRIEVPLLILHGERDMRCPVEGAHQLFTAVKDTHPELDVRLVVFPGENHEVTMAPGPIEARLRHYEENLRWFVRHLGTEAAPVVRCD
ncbi:MAG: S9 family peptidase [Clostridia bacterium]|nr:S9 family peptidase [Clostridia bacterium]